MFITFHIALVNPTILSACCNLMSHGCLHVDWLQLAYKSMGLFMLRRKWVRMWTCPQLWWISLLPYKLHPVVVVVQGSVSPTLLGSVVQYTWKSQQNYKVVSCWSTYSMVWNGIALIPVRKTATITVSKSRIFLSYTKTSTNSIQGWTVPTDQALF